MTALLPETIRPVALGPARLLAGIEEGSLRSYAHHRATHGDIVPMDARTLIGAVTAVGMRGRGGAAFPVGDKLAATATGRSTEVVVNLSEGEPASHKDRVLAVVAPHLVIDGALLVAAALRTTRISIVVRDHSAERRMRLALGERRDARTVQLAPASGTFVSGEARAVLRSIEGKAALPPGRRVLPSVAGVHGRPTFVSNAETFAHLGLLGTHGAEWYAEIGGASERGTTLLTLIGDVPCPGVVEVPLGTALSAIVGGGRGPVLVGGYHGTWLGDVDGLELDRVALRRHGVHLGAGVLARLPEHACALSEVAAVMRWLADQSAGQCGPCFFGLPALAGDLADLHAGRLPVAGLDGVRRRLDVLPGRGACAHPDGAVMFARSALAVLQTEIAQHLAQGGCGRASLGVLPLESPGVAA